MERCETVGGQMQNGRVASYLSSEIIVGRKERGKCRADERQPAVRFWRHYLGIYIHI